MTQPTTPAIRDASTPAHVTGASPGKKPIKLPSARANRSSTSASSRWATPTGLDTALINRVCTSAVMRALAAVPIAVPTGSTTREAP
jgi:hypothetical protein